MRALPRSRLGLSAALLVVGLLGPLIAWFFTGWSGVRSLQAAIDRHAQDEAAAEAANVAGRLAAILQVLRDRESQRPYFHYQSLYHDPQAADLGASVVPSPLVAGPMDPLIETYFQVGPQGALTVPTWNEDVPALNDNPRAVEGQQALALLRPSSVALMKLVEGGSGAPVEQVVDNNTFVQNTEANQIYNQIKGKQQKANGPPGGDVLVTIEPLRWAVVRLGDGPRLVAVRAVQSPAGRTTQGFVISTPAMARWLSLPERASLLVSDDDAIGAGVDVTALPLVRGAVRVTIEPTSEADRAAAKALLSREFLLRFVPISIATVAACALALFVVAQTERLARQRSQFAASAAHELRTPLAGLRLYADMLEGGLGDPEKSGEYARRIGDEAARLGRVVGNVLGFSQLERGAVTVRTSKQDVAAWLTNEVARLAPGLEVLGATLELAIDVEPLEVPFDPDALGQIVQNLVDNAEKYSRDAKDRTIHVHLRRDESSAQIVVRDHGPGIPIGRREAVFRPFVRGGGADQPAGVGLGLSISRALARAHGGELRVAVDRGETSLIVSVPLVTPA